MRSLIILICSVFLFTLPATAQDDDSVKVRCACGEWELEWDPRYGEWVNVFVTKGHVTFMSTYDESETGLFVIAGRKCRKKYKDPKVKALHGSCKYVN